jgi:hypothetical protein
MPFWKMIKEGYDHFEVTRQEPKVDFCEKKYVFNAMKAPNARSEPVFNASAKCPAYAIPDEVADAVREKQHEEQAETNKLISRGTPVARMNTGIDGGMNKVFAAKLPDGNTGLSEGGDQQGLSLLALSRAPGTIPSHVNPPKPKLTAEEEQVAATSTSAPATRVAAATPTQQQPAQQSEGWFSSLARKVGIGGGSDTTASAPPPASAPAAKPKAESKPATPSIVRATAAAPKQAEPKQVEPKQAAAKPAAPAPALKPSVSDAPAPAAAAPAPAATIAGAQPALPSNSFDSRFGAMK